MIEHFGRLFFFPPWKWSDWQAEGRKGPEWKVPSQADFGDKDVWPESQTFFILNVTEYENF